MFALIGLAVYIVLEFLRPEVLFGADLPIMFWVAVATLGIWLIEFSLRGWKWKTFPSTRFFCCFLAVATVSSVFNHATGEKLLLDFSDISKLLCIYLVLVESTDSPRKLDFVLAVMLLAILFLAVEAIAYSRGYAISGFRFDSQRRIEYSGIFKDSNDLGQIYAVGWTIILFHLVNGTGGLKKLVDVVLLVILAWAMLLTSSRGTMVAALIGVFLSGRERFGLVKPAILAFLIFVVMHQLGISRMNLLSTGETSAEERIQAWGQGWYMLRSNPLFGVGPHDFQKYHAFSPHSTLVQVGAETGLIGLFFWVGLLYAPLRTTILNLLPRRTTVAGVTFREFQMQAAALTCFVSCMFLTRAYILPLYLIIGLVLAAGRVREASGELGPEETAAVPARHTIWQVALAQMACVAFWRLMAWRFIQGI